MNNYGIRAQGTDISNAPSVIEHTEKMDIAVRVFVFP